MSVVVPVPLLDQRARAGDLVGDGVGVVAVEGELRARRDRDIACAERARGAAIAELQRAGIDGGDALIGVEGRQRQRARAFLDQ